LIGIVSLLVAAPGWGVMPLMIADRVTWEVIMLPLIIAVGFTVYGSWVIVRYLNSPKGPEKVQGFAVQLPEKKH